MGLNFRKSFTICKGVKVNLSKGGVSLSVGAKGLRTTISSKGRVTGSASLPGTGVYYTKSTNVKKLAGKAKELLGSKKDKDEEVLEEEAKTNKKKTKKEEQDTELTNQYFAEEAETTEAKEPTFKVTKLMLKKIYSVADEQVDWEKINDANSPEEAELDEETYDYLKSVAKDAVEGDIDTYLELIDAFGPLDDLLQYAGDFEFGTDKKDTMEVEFVSKLDEGAIDDPALVGQFVQAVALRVARDLFALLPVKYVKVHTVYDDCTILSAKFDRKTIEAVNYKSDALADIMSEFKTNTGFNSKGQFMDVDRL